MLSARTRLRRMFVLLVLVVGLFAIPAGSASAATCTNASITNKSYTLAGPTGLRQNIGDMTGLVRQGDTISLEFTVAANVTGTCTISLVSYRAPGPTAANLSQQQIYQSNSGDVTPGDWTIQVKVPDCYFQADFVRGAPIAQFSSTVTYTNQGRLLDAANHGTEACGPLDASLPPGPGPQRAGSG